MNTPNSEKRGDKDAEALIVLLSDAKLRKVARALSNETAATVLQKLVDKPMSASELSGSLKLPLTTVEYNLDHFWKQNS